MLLCFQLPAMLTGPLLGTVLDRWQPRLVMGIDNCTSALLIWAIPVLSWVGVLQLWQIHVNDREMCSQFPIFHWEAESHMAMGDIS